jgi:hypothetical protein
MTRAEAHMISHTGQSVEWSSLKAPKDAGHNIVLPHGGRGCGLQVGDAEFGRNHDPQSILIHICTTAEQVNSRLGWRAIGDHSWGADSKKLVKGGGPPPTLNKRCDRL